MNTPLFDLMVQIEELKRAHADEDLFELYKTLRETELRNDIMTYLLDRKYLPAIEFRIVNCSDRSIQMMRLVYLLYKDDNNVKAGELLISHFHRKMSQESIKQITETVDTGYVWAQYGFIYNDIDAYRKSAEKGYTKAHNHIGNYYARKQDFEMAFYHWKIYCRDCSKGCWEVVPLYILLHFTEKGYLNCAFEIIRRDTTRENILKYSGLFKDNGGFRNDITYCIRRKMTLEGDDLSWKLLAPFYVKLDDKHRFYALTNEAMFKRFKYDIFDLCQWYPVTGFKMKFYPEDVQNALFAFLCCMHRLQVLPKDIIPLIATHILAKTPERWRKKTNSSWFNFS